MNNIVIKITYTIKECLVKLQINKKRFGGQFDFSYVMNDIANTPRISISIYH